MRHEGLSLVPVYRRGLGTRWRAAPHQLPLAITFSTCPPGKGNFVLRKARRTSSRRSPANPGRRLAAPAAAVLPIRADRLARRWPPRQLDPLTQP